MKNNNHSNAENAFKTLSEIVRGPSAEHLDFEHGFRFFGKLLVAGAEFHRATSALSELFKFDKRIPEAISRKEFETALLVHFDIDLKENKAVSANQLKAFVDHLLKRPLMAVTVRRPIAGIELANTEAPLALGPFTLFNRDAHADRFLSGIAELHHTFLQGNWSSKYVIETTVHVRDGAMAADAADIRFVQFENAIRYLVGTYTSEMEVGVINVRDQRVRQIALASANRQSGFGVERVGPYRALPVDDPYFTAEEGGHARFWAMMNERNPCDLTERLLLAVDWIGQALADVPSANAFLKSAIALEVLFSKDIALVTPGIAHQFSECSALIVGDDLSARRDIYEQMKRLYKVRCNIAHAGRRQVPIEDVRLLIKISREVVSRLIVSPALGSKATLDDLFYLIDSLKYGGPAFSTLPSNPNAAAENKS